MAPLPSIYDGFSSGGWGIAIDPGDASHVITYGSQTSYSTDGGASWTQMTDHVLDVAFDPRASGVVYGALFSGPASAIVKSTDNGATFAMTAAPPMSFVLCILTDLRRPGTVYVGGGAGIWKSVDTGATWSLASATEASALAEDPDTGSLYALTFQDGVFLSNDAFQSSARIIPPQTGVAIAVAQSGTLLLATDEKSEMFVSKVDPNGSVVFTTYIGGFLGSSGTAIRVDSIGQIYIAGVSSSPNFPVTTSIQDLGSSPSMYLLKLSSDGRRLLYSTRIAGGVAGALPNALAVDASGSIYLAGQTGDGYPTTPNSAQPLFAQPGILPGTVVHQDAFATKIAADGKTLIYSTYFGIGNVDRAMALALDSEGNAYVGGTSLWKLDPAGARVLWHSTLGTGQIRAMTLDQAGNIYICGGTSYSAGFTTTANAFQKTAPAPLYFGSPNDVRFMNGDQDAFVAKVGAASGDLLYSTLLGGRLTEAANGIVVDAQGNAIVVGATDSLDFPARYPFQSPFSTHTGFLAKLNSDGSDLLYSTFLGDSRAFTGVAIGFQQAGTVILAGYTSALSTTVITGNDMRTYQLSPGQPAQPTGAFLNRIIEEDEPSPIHVDAILNAASIAGGPVTPGEWISVRGGGFDGNSDVLLGEQPLHSILVPGGELIARVPDTLQPAGASTIRVVSGNQSSGSVLVNTAPADPAIFTRDGTGFGQALAFNQDGSANGPGNPAAKGSMIDIVVNGVGAPEAGTQVQTEFSGASAVPAEVRSGSVPGLSGDQYSILRTAIPGDTANYPFFAAGVAGLALILDGVIQGPLFTVTISVK